MSASERYLRWVHGGGIAGFMCAGAAATWGIIFLGLTGRTLLLLIPMVLVGFIVGAAIGGFVVRASGAVARETLQPTAAGTYAQQHSAIQALEVQERFADAVRACAEYHRLGIRLIEEPVCAETLVDLPRLPIAVGLDESLRGGRWEARLTAVARVHTLGAVVLKPTALGGVRHCLAVAERAAALGADATVTHTFDGPIAMAAAAELALVTSRSHAAGLAPHDGCAHHPPRRAAAPRAAR